MYINLNKPILKPVNPRGSMPLPLKDCCKMKQNMITVWHRADLRCMTCQVCGHKYWRFWAEQGSLGAMH